MITLVGYSSKFFGVLGRVTGDALSIKLPRESSKLSAAFVAENTNVISGNAALDSVTLTAHNAWAGERVPNRVIADSPVPTAQLLLRQAADALAAHFDTKVVIGTTGSGIDPTSGLADLSSSTPVHDDTPGTSTAADFVNQISAEYFALDYRVRPRSTWVITRLTRSCSRTCSTRLRGLYSHWPVESPARRSMRATATPDFRPARDRLERRGEQIAYMGDLSRALMIYLRQGMVAESSRDAEFSLDNTLFRFGMRWDVAIVEPNQIKRFSA